MSAAVLALGAVSPLGLGPAAYRSARLGERPRVALAHDAELAEAGVRNPRVGRAPRDLGVAAGADRAADLLTAALLEATGELDRVRPGWRAERVGVVVGTSAGGMRVAERFFAWRDGKDPAARRAFRPASPEQALARGATYFAPLEAALAAARLTPARLGQVLAACASSTVALGRALRWLEHGLCDVVLAGGYDAISVFVAAGFDALQATSAELPRPFRHGRDGMLLGEGAAIAAMVRADDVRTARPLVHVAGYAATSDAVHITAPDRTGAGMARAAAAALADAALAPAAIDAVSAHATATPFNDAMEARALARLFAGVREPVVHPFKAEIGHALGAAGILETLATWDALARGLAPAAAGEGELDPDARVRLLDHAAPTRGRAMLKLSAAFGGANAALVLRLDSDVGRRPVSRPVYLTRTVHVRDADLDRVARVTGAPRDRLGRVDEVGRLALAAASELAAAVGRERLRGAAVVVGHALATLDTNDAFDARRRRLGPRAVLGRSFPATSPNAAPGEVSIALGLTGPGLAVGAGLSGGVEALAAGAELVAFGDADDALVLAVDDAGPAGADLLAQAGWGERALSRGAVAVLLSASPEGTTRRLDPRGIEPDPAQGPVGHLGLLAWLGA